MPCHCKALHCDFVPLHLGTFAPVRLCTFAPLHLCTFSPLHFCTIALYQPITNHLYVYIIFRCLFTSYTYTHWNYTNLHIKSSLFYEISPLRWSLVLCKNHCSDPLRGSPPPMTLTSSSDLLIAYFTLYNVRPFNWISFACLSSGCDFINCLLCGDYGQFFIANSCFCTSWSYSHCPDYPTYHQL